MQIMEILRRFATVFVGSSSLYNRNLKCRRPERQAREFGTRRAIQVLGVGLSLIVATSVAHAQFTVRLPQPTGPYQIGTAYFDLIDETRPEAFTDDPKDRRELLVRCWYPAQPVTGAKPEPFWGKNTKEIGQRLAEYLHLPKNAFDDLALVPSHAYTDAPLSRAKSSYPIVVFSHGYIPGFHSQNTVQMEELASHGYIVFSIGHTYETIVNIFPDGRTVPFSQTRLVAFGQELKNTSALNTQYMQAAGMDEKEAALRKLDAQLPVLEESLRVWTADTGFVLDELERMNSGKVKSIFAKKLDLKRIGILGMSFGGSTAAQFCAIDKRCKAGINLDGMQYGDLDHPMQRPFMYMHSEDGKGINRLFFERARNHAYLVTVKGSKHFNYSDFSLFSPDYKKAGFLGPIDGERMEKITSDYVLAFFDKYLKNKDSPLLKGPSADYPEVEFKSHGRQ